MVSQLTTQHAPSTVYVLGEGPALPSSTPTVQRKTRMHILLRHNKGEEWERQTQGKLSSGRLVSESPGKSKIPAWRFSGTGSPTVFTDHNPSLPCSEWGHLPGSWLIPGKIDCGKQGNVPLPTKLATL